ncbi:coatomer epsilon subunit family protein, putative [Ichthyophthirius multifiliis]|uniref:Coatomer epsilon subunit family protein, putative n=1 Tax=Ichthyophthirius multifiliis TaxID=5932 RepID=G0QWV3_ICHMU|nr:coatomer epsilon subunit family protein, putative [Ichthyophthirius multifiliis]EGR30295.1 coatomer epsilon subunit family protein, putative [Ichthyophthirius multifiliis]|eukprot:XP_004031882.1 coatomer epsilon subunit family protein, putative [Ichthyophthirius multifiliis]
MDLKEILDQYRQYYYLGNFQKILELWNQTEDSNYGEYLLQIDFLVARSIICLKELQPQNQVQFNKKPSSQLMICAQIASKYLAPLISPCELSVQDEDNQNKEIFIEFKEQFQQNNQSIIHLIIGCYIAIQVNDLSFFVQNEAKFKENFELLYLYVVILVKNQKFEQAEKKLNELRKMNDDDVLTLLATINYHICNEKYNEAVSYIDEIKERFGDSTKILNIKVSCLMMLQKWQEAYLLCEKLYQALASKQNLLDRSEVEVCFSNLIVISEILDKPTVEHFQRLEQVNNFCFYVKNYYEMKKTYMEFSDKLSLKTQ